MQTRRRLIRYLIYFFFLGSLLFNWKSPKVRGDYLYALSGISVLLGIIQQKYLQIGLLLLSILHSIIHKIWPFLNEQGYDLNEPPVYDVTCHFVMMSICYILITRYSKQSRKFHILSTFFLIGSFFNVLTSIDNGDTKESFQHHLFTWMSVFQGISTGYYISTLINFEMWKLPDFEQHWLFMIGLVVINWAIYKAYEPLVGWSMYYRYIEGLFIMSAITPILL